MKISRLLLCALCLTSSLTSLPASAQMGDNSQAMERVDRLERDIMLLQRQLARGGNTSGRSASVSGEMPAPAADTEVRLSTMEEQMRELRGKVEEAEFQSRKNAENLEKLQKDIDFRFSELSGNPAAAAAPADDAANDEPQAANRKPFKQPTDEVSISDADMPADTKPADKAAPTGPTTAGDGVLRPPQAAGKEGTSSFATPREHYNYAFRLLNQTQYEEASKAFSAFTKKYPKDPLVGNAFYWQGETYYIRRDYVNAADHFRQGFEAAPEGPKAADNLLKLGMSLDALGRDKEACVVLQQIVTKFKKNSTSVTQKADSEQKRIGCK